MDIARFLTDISDYYSKKPSSWNLNEYLSIYAENCPYRTYHEFYESAQLKKEKLCPTDNIELISKFRPVFVQLFDHALSLSLKSDSNQLKDFFDSIHCLSESLIVKEKWDSRAFWNIYIMPYCKRWNVKFPRMRRYFFRFFIFNRH